MLDANTLAHEASFEVCGREYTFSRSLDMLRRAESVVGPVAPFAVRLDGRACRIDEVARLYGAMLRDVAGAPTQREIDEWVFERGLSHTEFALYLYSLTLGSEELERVAKARGLNATATEEGRGPFGRTAASTGNSFSGSAAASAGRPPIYGEHLSSR